MKKLNDNDKFVVVCGAKAHFAEDGNHDMTKFYANKPSGFDITFYNRAISNGYYKTYSTTSASVNKNFQLIHGQCPIGDDIIFTKKQLNNLHRWLSHKTWGKMLVKSAKANTIKLNPQQIKNIKSGAMVD